MLGFCAIASLILVAALYPASVAKAAGPLDTLPEPQIPRFITLGSFSSNSTLKLDCDGGERNQEIQCDMMLVTIRKMSEEAKAMARLEFNKLDAASDADIQKAKNTFSASAIEKMKRRMLQSTPEQAAYTADFLASLESLRSSTNRSNIKTAIAKYNEMEANTCRIEVSRGKAVFTRITPYRWISNPGPQGLCNIVNVEVLESTAAYPGLWKHTQTRVSADVETESCAWLKPSLNKAEVFSWDYPNYIAPSCKYLIVE